MEQQILQQLAAMAEENRALNARLAAQEATAAQQQQQAIPQLLHNLPAALAAAMQASRREQRGSLTDNKGLGKPYSFDNSEGSFLKWSRKTTNYMSSVLKGLGPMLQLAVDNEDTIDYRVFRGSVVDVTDEDLD